MCVPPRFLSDCPSILILRCHLFQIFRSNDPAVLYLYINISLQYLILAFGFLGVFCSNRWMLRVYWLGMTSLLLSDIVIGVFWSFKLRQVHLMYPDFLEGIWTEGLNSNRSSNEFCQSWESVQIDLKCCGTTSVTVFDGLTSFCGQNLTESHGLPTSCCPGSVDLCGEATVSL